MRCGCPTAEVALLAHIIDLGNKVILLYLIHRIIYNDDQTSTTANCCPEQALGTLLPVTGELSSSLPQDETNNTIMNTITLGILHLL